MFAVGAAVFLSVWLYSGHLERRVLDLARWSTTTATVIHSSLWTYRNTTSPVIAYVYEVDGRRYKSSRIALGGWIGGTQAAYEFAAAHPAGSSVTISYDPEKPRLSVIITTVGARNYRTVAWFLGALFLIASVGVFFLAQLN
ncbi:MAG: DUF3592 domain-containing protein [Caulobacteraceae bacterium]